MKLVYWYAACLDDDRCYSIRERTKKAALAKRAGQEKRFGEVEKVEVEYLDGFDLLHQSKDEGGLP